MLEEVNSEEARYVTDMHLDITVRNKGSDRQATYFSIAARKKEICLQSQVSEQSPLLYPLQRGIMNCQRSTSYDKSSSAKAWVPS